MAATNDAELELEIRRLGSESRADFHALMDGEEGCSWCCCVAWWVPSWEGFAERSAAENRELREALLERGEYDGYLAYRGETPVGWCQVGPRDRLAKLVAEHDLAPDPGAFAITCFYVRAGDRRRGVSRALLRGVLADLERRSVARVEAFPRAEEELECGELWTGPRSLFVEHDFRVHAEGGRRILMVRELPGG